MSLRGDLLPHSGLLGDGSKDHRYAGMYVGLGIGIVLIIANVAHCNNRDTGCESEKTLARAPVVLVLLGGVGAIIGKALPKGR